MGDYDSDEEQSQFEKLRYASVPRGMFVSGWDDDADELIQEDKNPTASIERMILHNVKENNIKEVREILKLDGDAVNSIDDDGYTPLHRASYSNNIEMTKLLLTYKANPNARTNLGWTPLHSACKWSCTDCAVVLLQNGADVNAVSDGLQTPLHVAATVSNCRSMALILFMNPNIRPRSLNNSEETAETIARRTGMSFPIFQMGHSAFDCETGLID